MDQDRTPVLQRLRPREPGRRVVLRVATNGVLPVLVYLVARRWVGSDAFGLAMAGAIPLAWTLASLARLHRVDPVGVLALGGYALAGVATVIAAGSALPLELRRVAVSGVFGVACLISVVVRRPVLLPALRLAARLPGRAAVTERLTRRGDSEPITPRSQSIATLLIGLALLGEAAAQAALAVALPTSTFLLLRLAIGCTPAGVVLAYVHHVRARDERACLGLGDAARVAMILGVLGGGCGSASSRPPGSRQSPGQWVVRSSGSPPTG